MNMGRKDFNRQSLVEDEESGWKKITQQFICRRAYTNSSLDSSKWRYIQMTQI